MSDSAEVTDKADVGDMTDLDRPNGQTCSFQSNFSYQSFPSDLCIDLSSDSTEDISGLVTAPSLSTPLLCEILCQLVSYSQLAHIGP